MIDLIQRRLDSYSAANPVEEEQATREILQEVALWSLWRGGFFEVAAFQGGTSLRILHDLPRFSEDLDFILKQPDHAFDWQVYLEQLVGGFQEFGLRAEVLDKSRMNRDVRKALLKHDSVANQLDLSFYSGPADRKLTIKLEIDVNPPSGSGFEYSYLDFPLDYEVCHQDLGSNFALKIHALLCRPYLKGRDWYDFDWYVRQRVAPNFQHLQEALNQYGPWAGKGVEVDGAWLDEALSDRVAAIDWKAAAQDVEPFLRAVEKESLRLWGERFFRSKVQQLSQP